MNEPSVELIEKANSIMEGDCSIAIHGYDPATSFEYYTLIEEVSSFSSRFSRLDELTVSNSSLPALSCLDGATDFSQPLASDSVPTASQSATPASSARSTGAPQSSIFEDSTSVIDSSTPPESLEGSSSLEDSTSSVEASTPPGPSQESGTHSETATTATSRSGGGSSSTGATSVSTDGAPFLALNAGIFALIVAMLL